MQPFPGVEPPSPEAVAAFAPSGVMRPGINLSNFLLVTGKSANGDPEGVSPDLARAIAEHLGLTVRYIPYPSPGVLADAAPSDAWDLALIGAEPQRAEVIAFTPAYCEIQATYLVKSGSAVQSIEDADRAGVRISVADKTAYGLWLDRNIKHAEIVRCEGMDSSLAALVEGRADVLAGLKPKLLADVERVPGSRILEGRFMAVQQAVGVPRAKAAIAPYLVRLIEAAKASGFIQSLIDKHGVKGLSVAPPGA